ncbi:MAG: type I restriction-modification system subunit M, partial [Flavobacteriales bacterium]|nr:type I restriction-modification system subunit M [Flavobacteriales bacterium]
EEKLGKGKEMVDRLTKLIGIFENPALNFSKNRADGDDILGDAYEYLMRHFATESGKSKGQFYTPAEVSRILAKVIGVKKDSSQDQTVYDPTCGSGSLLLKVADEAPKGLTIYGQENDNATKALAVMNMWLHNSPTAEIWKGNTLASPHWKESDGSLKKFDFVVANPPFSAKSWSSGFEPDSDEYNRFEGFGIPPAKNGDYAFLLHIIKSLKSTGKGAIILPHGVLFRGGAEERIRTNIIQRGYIKGVIGLPANLFYGTGIPACIIVIDKENAVSRTGVFMIDASKGFIKDGNKNRLREQDLHCIVDVFNKQQQIDKFSRLVPLSEIESNEYNLNIPRYIDSQEEEDIQDLSGHLQGGIPERDVDGLSTYWKVYPAMRADLFAPNRPKYFNLKVDKTDVREMIFGHEEFKSYSAVLDAVFNQWKDAVYDQLKKINTETQAGEFIQAISEELLQAYSGKDLVDPYDMYQHLMDYWNDEMKDDIYMLIEDGWVATLEPITHAKGKIKKGEFDCELVPKPLVIARYFKEEQKAIDELSAELESFGQQMEEIVEEHGGDEGLISSALNDKGKITKGTLTARLKEIKGDKEFEDEREILLQYQALMEKEATAKKELKDRSQQLDQQVIEQYRQLSEDEVKTLVVDDKWLASIQDAIQQEIDAISQRLTARIKELAERYESTLSELDSQTKELEEKVKGHLQQMGLEWS